MKRTIFILAIFIAVMLIISCKKNSASESLTNNQPNPSNHPPVANASTDQTVALSSNAVVVGVMLDGSASSDLDKNLATYSWTQISGPSTGTILNTNAIRTQVNNLMRGVYQFQLKVTDVEGLSGKDTVSVTVIGAAGGPVIGTDSTSNQWTQLQYLPADEFFFGPGYWFNGNNFLMGIDSIIYAISNKLHLWKYDARTNTWSYTADFPETTSDIPVVFSINGKGYCCTNKHCWQYTPSTNQWIKTYLRNANNHIIEYDPSFDSYSVKNNCPASEELLGSFVINGYGFYVYNNGQCWEYNAGADKWQQKASLAVPGTLYNSSGFAVDSSGYILGDLNLQRYNFNESMKLFRYDFTSDKWSQSTTGNYIRNGAYNISAISFKGTAYVGLGFTNADFNAIDFWKFQ
jgi:hypothetical protein